MRKHVEYEDFSKDIFDERKKYRNTRPILKPDDIADGVVYVLFTPEHKEDFFSGSMCFVNPTNTNTKNNYTLSCISFYNCSFCYLVLGKIALVSLFSSKSGFSLLSLAQNWLKTHSMGWIITASI
jgi:hypothetical protein